MKNLSLTMLAAGALFLGIGGCSSSTTENTANTTAEAVETDRTTARTSIEATSANTVPPGSDSVAAFADTTSFHAIAASSDIFEVQSSVQAKARARHAEVKKFAETMLTNHTKTSEELKQIAGKRNLMLPNTPIAVHQRMLTELTNEEDADEFDEEYMEMQVDAHKLAVDLFESAAKNQTDPELKSYASRQLPHLRTHLAEAKRIKDLVK